MQIAELSSMLKLAKRYQTITKWKPAPTKTVIGMAKPDDHNQQLTITVDKNKLSMVAFSSVPPKSREIIPLTNLSFDQLEYVNDFIQKHF